MAELGVYQGGTAQLMALSSPNKTVHLFDTFAGLPYKNKEHDRMCIGELGVDITKVKKYLKDCSNVVFHAGLFPDTTKGLDCK